MPELPDLLYIEKYLQKCLPGRSIKSVEIKNSIVIRNALGGEPDLLAGKTFEHVVHKGHFLDFKLTDGYEIIMNLMLTGQLQHTDKKKISKCCFTINLDDGMKLNYGDSKLMGKIYFIKEGNYDIIPGYLDKGIDILSDVFTLEAFKELIKKSRQQVRVFVMDKTKLQAIGNAYADEILFHSRLHPKSTCNRLTEEEIRCLYNSIKEVMAWAIEYVDKKGEPIEVKVRDHVKIRNRKGEPCPQCGTTIRRASVLGYDTFFCPKCQPPTTKQFVEWET